jgi:predicted nucleotidyltransferase
MTRQHQILAALKRELDGKTDNQIVDIVLFGSQAKGKVNEGSDYDVLIVPKQKPTWMQRRAIGDVCAEISIENDILIDYKIISETEIEQEPIGCHPLIVDALKYGIHA